MLFATPNKTLSLQGTLVFVNSFEQDFNFTVYKLAMGSPSDAPAKGINILHSITSFKSSKRKLQLTSQTCHFPVHAFPRWLSQEGLPA